MPAKIEIDWGILDGILKCGANKVQCANILGCSADTIEARIKEHHDNSTFTQYRQTKMDHTSIKLIQKAISDALAGNTVILIFCLKNLCGWADKREDIVQTKVQINIDGQDSDL